jgi:ankyrin repeat protein
MIRELVKLGADVNASIDAGWTPLWQAVARGRRQVVLELVKLGALIDKVDAWGGTPLLFASQQGQSEMVRWLLGLRADTGVLPCGISALVFADISGHAAAVSRLAGWR